MSEQGFVGQEVAGMQAFEAKLLSGADELARVRQETFSLMGPLRAIWRGEVTEAFAQLWSARHAPAIGNAEESLRWAAGVVRRNLEAQVLVSDTLERGFSGADVASRIPGFGPLMRALEQIGVHEIPEQIGRLYDLANNAPVDGTREQQRAYWDALTDRERELALQYVPELVLDMEHLPEGVLADAEKNVQASVLEGVAEVSASKSLKIEAGLFGWGPEGTVEWHRETIFDGRSTVTVTLDADLAVGLADFVDVSGGGETSLTYEFDNAAQAEAFEQSLRNVAPGGVSEVLSTSDRLYDALLGDRSPDEIYLAQVGSASVGITPVDVLLGDFESGIGIQAQGSTRVGATVDTGSLTESAITYEQSYRVDGFLSTMPGTGPLPFTDTGFSGAADVLYRIEVSPSGDPVSIIFEGSVAGSADAAIAGQQVLDPTAGSYRFTGELNFSESGLTLNEALTNPAALVNASDLTLLQTSDVSSRTAGGAMILGTGAIGSVESQASFTEEVWIKRPGGALEHVEVS